MAVNENVNKVVCNGSTLIDLTEDTVEPSVLVSGYTAHDASGAPITGTLELFHTEEYEGATVTLPAGATFDKLEILGNTVDGESVKGYNLLDVSTNTSGYYINASGVVTSDPSFSVYTDLIPVVPGGTYTIQGHSGRANNKRLHAYKQNGTWARQVMYFTSSTAPVGSDYSNTVTLGSDVYFLRFSYAGEDTDVQISRGSSVRPYMPYRAIGVKVTNALGMDKTTVPIDLGAESLESYQDSADVLTITAGGTTQITKNGPDPSVIALDPIEWPVIEDGDIFSLVANLSTTLVLTCTIGVVIDATLVSKQITANGTYNASDDSADGYSDVTVNVPTTGADLGTKAISANGTYEADDDSLDGYSSVTVNVPNSYTASDEGKVVSSGSLVAQTSTTKTANGTYDTTLNDEVTVNVPNSYTASDEGKVVSSGSLVSQTSTTKTANGTYDTTLNDEVTVDVEPNVDAKTVTENGTYNSSSDFLDGYSSVTVNVPNSYTASDEGKVVSSGALVSQTSTTKTTNGTYDTTLNDEVTVNVEPNVDSKTVNVNGTYNASSDSLDGYSSVTVNVPNSYTVSDEGKVVSSGSLVAQTSTTKTANGTYDTTLNDEVTVNVPNSYTASDEGKVVSSGSLVSQTSTTKTVNGTYDTTLNDEVTVNVEPNVDSKTVTVNGTYDAEDDSLDGYSSVTVNVAFNVAPKSVTENGTYEAGDDSLDGYSKVVVSVTPEPNPYDEYANKTLRVIPSTNAGMVSSVCSSAFYSFYGLESANFPNCSVVAESAFAYCLGLKAVSLPSCTSIGSYAFQFCHALRSASFPACTFVGGSAFANCSALSIADFPEITGLTNSVFYYCTALERISFPKLKSVYNLAFACCWALSEVYLPELTYMQQGTFSSCYNLERANLPKLSSIGNSGFGYCIALREVSAPVCTAVGNDGFWSCGLSEIALPECSMIGDNAFRHCGALSAVNVPKCAAVKSYAFEDCRALSELSLPACETIGGSAFANCTGLSALYLMGESYVSISTTTFQSSPLSAGGTGTVYVPSSMYQTYLTLPVWSTLSSRLSGI